MSRACKRKRQRDIYFPKGEIYVRLKTCEAPICRKVYAVPQSPRSAYF